MKSLLKFTLIPLLLQALTSHAALTVTNIAPGSTALHSLFIKSDGSLWAMGLNQYGELGDGANVSGFYTTNNIEYNWPQHPAQIVPSNVTAIAAGQYHSLFIKSDGSLWAMGANFDGQLGDPTSDSGYYYTNRPEQILSSNVTAIAAGEFHSLFIKSDGSLWGMGFNGNGELGDGTPIDTITATNRPEQIEPGGVKAIAAGYEFSLFVKSDGTLWGMGNNNHGQLGDGTSGTAPNYTNFINRPEQIPASNVTAVAAGSAHTLFLESDGSLWAMGDNTYGQLGDGTYNTTNPTFVTLPEQIVPSGVTAIAAGGEHSLFLRSDGSLWAMGGNFDGQLGDATGLRLDAGQPKLIVASNVTAIAAGEGHSLFLKSDGSLWVMGSDEYGQLGDGFLDNIYFPGIDTPEQIFPSPQPVLSDAVSSQTNLQVTAACGFAGNYRLLGSTNLALPLSQWLPICTNSVLMRGPTNFSVTLTNTINSGPQQFFILQSQ